MSDLERRREAKDMWISRGHILSAGVGVSLLLVVAFAVGYRMGQAETTVEWGDRVLEISENDRQLQELLERLDALKEPSGVGDLTFPDLKKGRDAEHVAAPQAVEKEASAAIAMSDHSVPSVLSSWVGSPPTVRHVEWLSGDAPDEIADAANRLTEIGIEVTVVMEKSTEGVRYRLVSTSCDTVTSCAKLFEQNPEIQKDFSSFKTVPGRAGNN